MSVYSNNTVVGFDSGHILLSVFQLGLFLRALCPARTGLRPARFTRALPELKKKINLI